MEIGFAMLGQPVSLLNFLAIAPRQFCEGACVDARIAERVGFDLVALGLGSENIRDARGHRLRRGCSGRKSFAALHFMFDCGRRQFLGDWGRLSETQVPDASGLLTSCVIGLREWLDAIDTFCLDETASTRLLPSRSAFGRE